jgi:glycosyltransferase involved in cell wall biosynthesis
MSHSPSITFVSDRFVPAAGMEKALRELVTELTPYARMQLVGIAGRESNLPWAGTVHTLGCDAGWRGRIAALPKLRSRLKHDTSDIIITVGIWAFVTAAVATMGNRRRFVLWEHSVLPWRLTHEGPLILAAVGLRLFAHRLSGVVAVSEATRRACAPLCWPVKPVCISNMGGRQFQPGRESVPRPPREGGTVRLLGTGSLIKRKNWQLAVKAMTLLPKHFELEIAGVGTQDHKLRAMIDELQLGSRVRLLGWRTDVEALIRSCDVVVQPSYAETFGFSLMEAAEGGVPVAALALPVMDEFIPTYVPGALAEASTPQGFATAILDAINGRYDFLAATRARARAFSPELLTQQWLAFLSTHAAADSGGGHK